VDEYLPAKRRLPHQDNSSDSDVEIDIEKNDPDMIGVLSDGEPDDSDEDLSFLPTFPDPDPLPTLPFFRSAHEQRKAL